jgi:predicted DNA-binding transcriptional regulator AlpA
MRAAATGQSDLGPTTVKTRQARKIRELGDALVLEGFLTLDQQAQALGLCRSTTWTILKADHKASGLSASVINRMLAAARLPPLVRAKMLEYIDEKIAGSYGHSKTQIRRFTARLSGKGFNQARTNFAGSLG